LKKTIKLYCHGPIAFGSQYRSPWEDVWIKYFSGKRKKVSEGPCIISRSDLQGQIDFHERRSESADSEWRREIVEDLLRVKSEFSQGNKFALMDPDMETATPDIYVNEEFVDKKLAEEAIEWYLKKKGVLKDKPRFQWDKPDRSFVITPVGY